MLSDLFEGALDKKWVSFTIAVELCCYILDENLIGSSPKGECYARTRRTNRRGITRRRFSGATRE